MNAIKKEPKQAPEKIAQPEKIAPPPRSQVSEKVTVTLSHRQDQIADVAEGALGMLEHHLFYRGRELVQVVLPQGPAETYGKIPEPPEIVAIQRSTLQRLMAKAVHWQDFDRQGELIPVAPPEWCVKMIYEAPEWRHIRQLLAVVETPILRPDGSVLDKPGWDADTCILYEPNQHYGYVSKTCSAEEAHAYGQEILDLFVDFPFMGDSAHPEDSPHRSGMLAAVITPLVRHAFDGPSPLFLIDKNMRGAGASRAVDAIGCIVSGRPMKRLSNTHNDEEMEKRITTFLRGGSSTVMIDNVENGLGTPSLDAALTSQQWSSRKLGTQEIINVPAKAVWYATGNNVALLHNIERRVLKMRMETPLERPETRTGFKYPDLLQHCIAERGVLVPNALSIVASYMQAGMPSQNLSAWGSFEDWSNLVRCAIVWAGFADPWKTKEDDSQVPDEETIALRAMHNAWLEWAGWESRTVADLLETLANPSTARYAHPTAIPKLRAALEQFTRSTTGGKLPTAQKVGHKLREYKHRVLDKKAIVMDGRAADGNTWAIRLWDTERNRPLPLEQHPVVNTTKHPDQETF